MNKRLSQYFLTCCLSAVSCYVFANDAKLTSYKLAIQRSLEKRPELDIERAKMQAAEARINEARGAFLPSLDIVISGKKIEARDNFTGITATATVGNNPVLVNVNKVTPKYEFSDGIAVNYNLYSGGKDEARFKEMLFAEQAARAQYDVIKKQIIGDVSELYWGMRKAQISLQISNRTLDSAKKEMEVVKKKFEEGRIAQIEFYAKSIAVEKAIIAVRSATRALNDFRRRYTFAIGIDAANEVEYQQYEPKDKSDVIDISTFLHGLGLMLSPEVKKARADLISAQSRVTQAKSEYLPTLDFSWAYTDIGRSNSSFGDAYANAAKDATTFGFQLKWNFFAGFKTDSRVARAVAESQQSRLQIEIIQRVQETLHLKLLGDEEEVNDQRLLANKQLQFAQAQLGITRNRFKTGQISALELSAAELAVDSAKSALDSLEIDTLIQRIKNILNEKS